MLPPDMITIQGFFPTFVGGVKLVLLTHCPNFVNRITMNSFLELLRWIGCRLKVNRAGGISCFLKINYSDSPSA
jgi:hypothetical protein